MLLHVCSVMKYVHFYINARSSTTSWLIIHDIMYTSRYNTINAVGYAYIKYEKETGYHDSAYVPQCTNMCNALALHQKGGCMSPHKCAPKWHLFFGSSLLHVTKSWPMWIYAGTLRTAHICHCVQLCGSAIYKPTDIIYQYS